MVVNQKCLHEWMSHMSRYKQQEHPVSPQAEVDAFEAAQAAIREQDKQVHDFLHAAAKRLEKQPNEVEAVLEDEPKRELSALRIRLEEMQKSAPPPYETAHCLQDAGTADMPVALRGDLRKPGEMVPRRFLEIIAGKDSPPFTEGSGRLDMANAIASKSNPLTAER